MTKWIYTNSSCVPIVPIPRSGGTADSHSCLNHFLSGLLQSALFIAQKVAINIVLNFLQYTCVTPLFCELHCLLVGFKVPDVIFKALHVLVTCRTVHPLPAVSACSIRSIRMALLCEASGAAGWTRQPAFAVVLSSFWNLDGPDSAGLLKGLFPQAWWPEC